jgi:hypothetical protein
MNRFAVSLPLILFASLAAADSPRRLTIAEQVDYLHRNMGLIKSVVGSSLSLAGAEHPLDRADACSKTAADLSQEIQKTDDSARAAELAFHLRKLLSQGVAANLTAARNDTTIASTSRETVLRDVQNRTVKEMRSLEDILLAAPANDDLDRAILWVREGRSDVEKAVTWPKKETEK